MKKVGYVYGICEVEYIAIQKKALLQHQLDTIVVEEDIANKIGQTDEILREVIGVLESGDQLVIYELGCLGKTIIQLGELLEELRVDGIELVVLNKKLSTENITNQLYMEFIGSVSESEKLIIRRRTTRGIEDAKRRGRIGGRPKISEKTIKQIRYLYHNQSYTLREIAEECDISVGTAYKYIQKNKKEADSKVTF